MGPGQARGRARLKPAGSPIKVRGAGCTTSAHPYEPESASVGGVELEGGNVLTVDGRSARAS